MARTAKLIGRARESVPEGTFAVGAGLLIASVTSYVFLILSLNALEPVGQGRVRRVLGSDLRRRTGLLPAARAGGRPGGLAPPREGHRRRPARPQGGPPRRHPLHHPRGRPRSPCRACSRARSSTATSCSSCRSRSASLGFYAMHMARGTLAGNGRFGPYGELLAIEGIARLIGAVALVALGVDNAGAYGMCLALAPFVAVGIVLARQRGLLKPGPDAPYSELSNALGYLLAGSVLMQLLGYSPLLAVNLLETSADKAAAATFTTAFVMARIPILLFQAVQGTLLPKLAGLAGAGRHDDFRAGLKRLMWIVVGVAVLGSVLAFTLGPIVGRHPLRPVRHQQRQPRAPRDRERRVHRRAHGRAGADRPRGPRPPDPRLARRDRRVLRRDRRDHRPVPAGRARLPVRLAQRRRGLMAVFLIRDLRSGKTRRPRRGARSAWRANRSRSEGGAAPGATRSTGFSPTRRTDCPNLGVRRASARRSTGTTVRS